ncbi:MAG: TetR/AcrR family transcriptional regulator [Thermoleophilaceae bacterium]
MTEPATKKASANGRKRVPRAEREEQILSIAERQFAESGYYAVSMDAIAGEVGLSKQMVYNYVGSKEELYLTCFRRARFHLERVVDQGAAQATGPQEQLWYGVLAFFTFIEEHREAWSILNEQASARGGPFAGEVAAARAEIGRLISQLLTDARAAAGKDTATANTEITAFTIVGAAEGMASWWLDHPEIEKEYVVARLMDVVWMGLDNLLHDHFWDHPVRAD